ncbi:mannose-1-phosphate guanylyltransferase/mannose-6-phosphate isomerase [Photorhabdus aegyptia]|uniref:mannose-1-phosphate guanylyltransferase/mannose-6-phosphate isomerase n=1 Tax=Photorhabdus aegyptia TaxID=2805098 RepID=UPI001E5B3CF3|nr:mannose-1-phosphate guanylyltransferase/mannose-6-phosphate isomerase [Photorhabdus aegyptia]MCC8459730.1 mannose-1-phosphate guanylyltransferase/mannose-6-phosphate isomerase [Photorhabdus aegyptia]
MNILPVIMAGGSGSRLWPLSRQLYPKQFLALVSESSMLQETISRLGKIKHQPPLIICNEEHRFIIAEQLRQKNFNNSGIILEPIGRNTAPAIALAALHSIQSGNDPILLVLAADHIIQNQDAFINAVSHAIFLANSDKLITFGIVPTNPETGYGYIKKGKIVNNRAYKVAEFIEKPNLDTAKYYLSKGEYYWNSGMFMFKASRYLNELERYRPDILDACRNSITGQHRDLDFIRLNEEAFLSCPNDSIDYAVMEKTTDAVVVPMDANWSDVGSWSAIWHINKKDSNNNSIHGDVLIENTYNSYIYSQNKLITTVGIDNLVIVETKDALLVAQKDQVQNVKKIVDTLKKNNRQEYLKHQKVFRPWGYHDTVIENQHYHVKEVIVKPGQKIATQIHNHRAEHWIVVSGTAKVYKGNQAILVTENKSTYIPVGIPHSIENPGIIPLVIIEIHTGSYLSEEDVIRIDKHNIGY